MIWFAVDVEHESTGIRATHYVQAHGVDAAREKAEGPGIISIGIRTWGPNTRFPNLPDFVGRYWN